MKLTITTPTGPIAEHTAAYVGIPGMAGDFGVLPGHQPLVSTLRPQAEVEVKEEKGNTVRYQVSGGFAEVSASGVTILTETATKL